MINHGTRGGYYAHRRLSKPSCAACRAAINEYVREYRKRNGLERNREREQIRRKALAALRDTHRDEYEMMKDRIRQEGTERNAEKIRRRALAELRDTHREEYEMLVEQIHREEMS